MLDNKVCKEIFQDIENNNGFAMFVGGCVRDYFLGIRSKDIDIEVYHMSYQNLKDLLAKYGDVDLVGQSFGIIKLNTKDGCFDFSLPRKDNKNGVSHKDFDIEVCSTLSVEEAAIRRDFTINSMGMDINGKLFDPFGGKIDLLKGILRPTSSQFLEDSLRCLRLFKFSARYDMYPSNNCLTDCIKMLEEYQYLPQERIWNEWKDWALNGKFYRKSLKALKEIGWSQLYSELHAIYGIKQDHQFHPEGTVDIHTGYVLEEMAYICEENNITGDERLVLIFSALCHDFGKAECTEKVFVEKYNRECIRAIGHEKKSGPLARSFLESIGCPERIIEKVIPLVENHMVHEKLSDRAIRRLARRLFPATIEQLVHLIQADHFGRPPIPKKMSRNILYLSYRAMKLGCFEGMQEPLIRGQDIVDFGYEPGPIIGKIQRKLYEMQLNGSFDNKEEGLKRIKGFVNNLA